MPRSCNDCSSLECDECFPPAPPFILRLRLIAEAVKGLGDRGHGPQGMHLFFHGVTYEEAAQAVDAGARPQLNTANRSYSSTPKWETYFSLNLRLDGMSFALFTVDRPALPHEIEAVAPAEVPATIAVPAPPPVQRAEPDDDLRFSLIEVDDVRAA